MEAIRKTGYDPGFNANKIAQVQGSDILTYVLPSSVGLANRGRKDGLTLGGVVRSQRATRHPFRVVFEGIEYLVGPNVDEFTRPIDRMDYDRFTDSPELRATFMRPCTGWSTAARTTWPSPLPCRWKSCRTKTKPCGLSGPCAVGWWASTSSAWMA